MKYRGKTYGLMLYDQNDFPVGYFNEYTEVAKYLGTSVGSVQCTMCRGGFMRSGYRLHRIPMEGEAK